MVEPRLFSVEEANALVPFLQERFQRIAQVQEVLRGSREDMKVLVDIWGKAVLEPGNADNKLYAATKERMDALAEELKAESAAIAEKGCVVKDLNEGLVDFYHKLDEQLVLLCWKFPETAVSFWHEASTGFAARKPLKALRAL